MIIGNVAYPVTIQRRSVTLSLFIGFACLAHACQDKGLQPDALGGVGEVLVVSEVDIWQGEIGRDLRKALSSEQFGLPQPEPWFKLIPVQDLGSNKFQSRHRFILNVRLGEDFEGLPKSVALVAEKAVAQGKVYWGSVAHPRAFPQREVWLIARDSVGLAYFLQKNSSRLRRQFLQMDKQLIMERLGRLTSSDTVKALVRDTVGFQMRHLPGDYRIKRIQTNRVWLSKEIPQGSMNLFLWREAIPQGLDLTSEARFFKAVQAARDSVLTHGIPGPTPGSQYRTEMLIPPLWEQENSVTEGRGLWKMEGDFMGGPFVHRAWQKNELIYHAEAFVYCPNEPKRAWLRELEALLSAMATVDSSKS